MYRIATVLLAVSVAFGMRLSASAETIFESWSEKTAVVNISEDGRKGWIKALPANGEKKAKLVVPTGFNHAPTHAKASAPLSCVFALDELPAGEVRFAVTPINCWGRRGTPLVSEWAGHIAVEMLDASVEAGDEFIVDYVRVWDEVE